MTGQLGATIQGALLLALGLLVTGCPPLDGVGDATTDGQPTGSIKNPISDLRISGEGRVTIVYTAGPENAEVTAFYIEVASTAPDASTIGAKVVFGENLPASTEAEPDRTVDLDVTPLPFGIYRIGLDIAAGGQTLRVFSTGTIQITTLPDPVFTLPNQDLFAQPGGNINISATVGDPENAVQWRLFYIAKDQRPSAAADEYGTQITAGSANVAQATWFTAGVPLGEYEIGIFVTDSGQTIADTVASGNSDEINGPFFNAFIVTLTDEPPTTLPPSVIVTQPSSNKNILVTDPDNDSVLVVFEVTFFQGPPASRFVDVFFDFDGIADTDDERFFSAGLREPLPPNAAFLVDQIEVGTTAFLGVTAHDGVTASVTRYAPGTVRHASLDDTVFNVTSPAPGTFTEVRPGNSVLVRWQLNAPEAAGGAITVYRRPLDNDNNPLSSVLLPADIVTSGLPLNKESYNLEIVSSGRFNATVKVDLDGDPDPLIDSSGVIVASTIPDIIWLGGLDPLPPFDNIPAQLDGAIFEGIQFEDNAGSAFEGGVDFDGDGLDECFMLARYAKPFFQNPSGIGAGEAYMLRGRGTRYQGVLNLNSVAGATIPGLVFAGLPVDQTLANPGASPDDTDGLSNIFLSTTTVDGDAVSEIVFSVPWARSRQVGELGGPANVPAGPTDFCPLLDGTATNPSLPFLPSFRDHLGWEIPHFFRGGAVIYSSRNTVLSQSFADTQGVRIDLEDVGQSFAINSVIPEFGDGAVGGILTDDVCTGDSSWTGDFEEWMVENTCPTGPTATGGQLGCFTGTDDIADTLGRPEFTIFDSFEYALADPFVCGLDPDDGYNRFLTACGLLLSDNCPANDTLCDPNFPSSCDDDQFSAAPFCLELRELKPPGAGEPTCDPPFPNTCDGQQATARRSMPVGEFRWGGFGFPFPAGTGFYPDQIDATIWNDPFDGTIGTRVIGDGNFDGLGVTVTQSGNDLILASKFTTAGPRTNGGVGFMRPFTQEWQLPLNVDRYDPATGPSILLDKPHQDVIDRPNADPDSGQPFAKGIRGDDEELIETIVAIPDFNEDTRNDIAVGAPLADVNGDGALEGAVYIVFRRAPSLEGIFELRNLKLPTDDAERLSGVLIREEFGGGQRFGQSIDGDVDFNHDGKPDVVIGNPDGNGGTGEIVVLFSDRNLITQAEGLPVEGPQGVLSRGSGLRITGIELASEFGIFVKNVGDIDGDGRNDIAVAAPNATPKFDSTPSDEFDVLDANGLDGVVDKDGNRFADEPDGIRDDVTGPLGFPDQVLDVNDELRHAGLVYIILGSSFQDEFHANPDAVIDVSITELGTDQLDGFIVVGRRGDRYAVGDPAGTGPIAHHGDFLAGGDMGRSAPRILFGVPISYGGNPAKGPLPVLDSSGGFRFDASGNRLERQRGQAFAIGTAGDVDGDGSDELLIGAPLADPRVDPRTGVGTRNGGEAYLIYGFNR